MPIGFNLVTAPNEGEIETVPAKMAANKINYCRIWLGQEVWDVEHRKSGMYDESKARILDRFIAAAGKHGIRVKMCVEYFRDIPPRKQRWSDKTLHHKANGGPFDSMEEFLNSEPGISQFKRKLAFYQSRYGNHPAVFGWELWNEVDCVRGDWLRWTKTMLPELRHRFPKNLALQSLGSFDHARKRDCYRTVCRLAENDVAQVHRYLDLGAALEVCHGPVDVLLADAVRELRAFGAGKPILVAETGAVKPRHTGCSELYAKDKAGMILHDTIFAPFFAGAAGTGNTWWWHQCIQEPDQWHHFARFAKAVEGIDPPAEEFEPLMIEHPRLKVYVLKGKSTLLAWCRDKENNWHSELQEGREPVAVKGAVVDFSPHLPKSRLKSATAYDPWTDTRSRVEMEGGKAALPSFRRSVVVRLEYGEYRARQGHKTK